MALSTAACKNLVETLQKLSLAGIAVSVALLSNALLTPNRVTEEAAREFRQLMSIKEQTKELGFGDCVREEIEANGKLPQSGKRVVFGVERSDRPELKNFAFRADIPSFFYVSGDGEISWIPSVDTTFPPLLGIRKKSRTSLLLNSSKSVGTNLPDQNSYSS